MIISLKMLKIGSEVSNCFASFSGITGLLLSVRVRTLFIQRWRMTKISIFAMCWYSISSALYFQLLCEVVRLVPLWGGLVRGHGLSALHVVRDPQSFDVWSVASVCRAHTQRWFQVSVGFRMWSLRMLWCSGTWCRYYSNGCLLRIDRHCRAEPEQNVSGERGWGGSDRNVRCFE